MGKGMGEGDSKLKGESGKEMWGKCREDAGEILKKCRNKYTRNTRDKKRQPRQEMKEYLRR